MPALYLVLLGFSLTAVIGLLASGVDRKVTARIQYRVGPPLWQPFIDLVKLMGKENLIPEGASLVTFLGAPLVGFAGVVFVSTLLWLNNSNPLQNTGGDVTVVFYLLLIPSISLIVGGFASKNPLASIGASREIKLVLSYELPFVVAALVPIIKTGYTIRIGDILNYQIQNGPIVASWSGALALLVGILWMQAKLGLVPFDIAEAETEIVSGPLVEYSGPTLAMIKLTRAMLLFVLPFFLIILFMGGLRGSGLEWLWSVLKYLALVVATVLIRNTNPRVRIDQAMKFFWGPVMILALLAMGLALGGF